MSSDEDKNPGGLMSRRMMRGFSPAALKKAREARKVGRAALARSAGVSSSTVRRWENGQVSPGVDLLAQVAVVLGIEISDVVLVPVDTRYPGDWRVLKGLTQMQLAAAVGVTTEVIGAIERGERVVPYVIAAKLAKKLGISVEELVAANRRAHDRGLDEPA
ncbi:helix-turn-helix transcriptional regulator [Rhodococcus sp. 5A-K4]|uniref:helix-turn-helix transcriptional regulator n=1 Tax=Rhodococcus sp. 5A-K4 TaxID=3384442 RepID=UPI00137177A5|nr:helix-turn-helix domain-containing protein [Rhodococcus erythropolis]